MNPTIKYTEEEVVQKILNGEKALYEVIVRRYNPVLYKIGRSYNYNHETTQDLMQDTFIDAYNSLKQFENRSSFKTWVIRIMLNNCYRKNKKSSFKNEIMRDIKDEATPLYANQNRSTEKIVNSHDLNRVIEEVLSMIPYDYRIVFSLREVNELNVAETAELLSISESNVKTRLSRAKSMLRDKLEQSYTANELYDFNLIYCDGIVNHVLRNI